MKVIKGRIYYCRGLSVVEGCVSAHVKNLGTRRGGDDDLHELCAMKLVYRFDFDRRKRGILPIINGALKADLIYFRSSSTPQLTATLALFMFA